MELNITQNLTEVNFTKGTVDRIKYLVIHYVGAEGSAESNAKYFKSVYRGSSAHYFVDYDGSIVQVVEDKDIAWHCGAKTYVHKECRNSNSIGIELCCKIQNGIWYFTDETVKSAIELTRRLMNKYKIRADHVVRHYDVTGKVCPAPYVYNNTNHTWSEFLDRLTVDELDYNPDEPLSISNEKYIWDFLTKEAHFTPVVTAGIMGNLFAESHLMPNNLQNTYNAKFAVTDDEYTALIDNGVYTKDQFIYDKAGYGLAQWTFWSRKKAMYEFLREGSGGEVYKSIGNIKGQIAFFVWELSHQYKGIYDKLRLAQTIDEASDIMLLEYEKPADKSKRVQIIRQQYSKTIYNDQINGNTLGDEKIQTEKAIIDIDLPFLARVLIPDLTIRTGPSTRYNGIGTTGKGVFTIIDIDNTSKWGKLKSGKGWIYLGNKNYTVPV